MVFFLPQTDYRKIPTIGPWGICGFPGVGSVSRETISVEAGQKDLTDKIETEG